MAPEISMMKMTSYKLVKLDCFNGTNFKRWKKVHFLLTLNIVYVLIVPKPTAPENEENETLTQNRKRQKWEQDDYLCKGHILNSMADTLFDVYQHIEMAKELWEAFEEKYKTEDSRENFLANRYLYHSDLSLWRPMNAANSILYTAVYTSLPNIFVGSCDQDLSRKMLLKYPQLYGVGPREESYTFKLFVLTMMDSLWQSLAIFFIIVFVYGHSSLDGASLGDIWIFALVLIVNLHLAMDVIRWETKIHAVIWGSTILTFGFLIMMDSFPGDPDYRNFYHLISSGVFWLTILSILIIALLPRFACKMFTEYLRPDDIRIGREMEKLENEDVKDES